MKSSALWRNVTNWLPVIVWAAVIFLFSTDLFSDDNTGIVFDSFLNTLFPWLSEEILDAVHFLVRKLGHFGAFFILAVLIMRALRHHSNENRVGLALALTALYAVSDELHQFLVPSRTASAADVLIDLIGGVCGTFWSCFRNRGQKAP
jgi:VanZ family protein